MALTKLLTNWKRLILLAALLLSGCFRPAGDSIQPTSEFTVEPVGTSGTPSDLTAGTPAITMLAPESTQMQAQATATSGGIALTQITLAPATSTATEGAAIEMTATLQLITPGISLGLVTPDTPTPLPMYTATPIGGANLTGDSTEESPFAAVDSGGDCTYTVQPGDTLYQIALTHDTTVAALQDANPDLESDPILQIEQVLNLPDCEPGVPSPTSALVGTEEIGTALPPGSQLYTVQPGDVLGSIASHFGVSVNAIMRANDMNNPDVLSIGQELIIPAAPTPTTIPIATAAN